MVETSKELVQINTGIKRLVKLIESSSIVDKANLAEMRKEREESKQQRQWTERERDEKGRFVKKEKDIQALQNVVTDKQQKLVKSTFGDWKKQKDEQWKLIKQNHILFRLSRAFWESKAGQAIKNVFGRVKTIFMNIMGEIGEFFTNLWETTKDAFNFVKGTVGGIVEATRGGDKKERREKKQATDIETIKKVITGEVKRDKMKEQLARAKKGKGLFKSLGFASIFKVFGSIGAMASALWGLLSAMPALFILGSIAMAVLYGVRAFFDGYRGAALIGKALRGLVELARIVGGWVAKLFDMIFGTNLQEFFKKQDWDAVFDKYITPAIEWFIEKTIDFGKWVWGVIEDGLKGILKERIDKALNKYVSKIPFIGDEDPTKVSTKEKAFTATGWQQLKMMNPYYQLKDVIAAYKGEETSFGKYMKEMRDLQKESVKEQKETNKKLDKPQPKMSGPAVMTPPNSAPIQGDGTESQRQNLVQNTN
jgi:hypothetical protein